MEKNVVGEQPRPSLCRDLWRSLEPGMEMSEDMLELYRAMRVPLDEEDGQDAEDKVVAFELLMYSDRRAAGAFRDSLIPYATQWYTGETASVDSDVEEEGGYGINT